LIKAKESKRELRKDIQRLEKLIEEQSVTITTLSNRNAELQIEVGSVVLVVVVVVVVMVVGD